MAYSIDVLELVLSSIMNEKSILGKDHFGRSFLHKIRDTDGDKVYMLVGAGLRVNDQDIAGLTPLHVSVSKCHYGDSTVEALLRCGADPNLKDNGDNIALHHASAARCSVSVLPMLLLHGSRVNSTNKLGRTPLHLSSDAMNTRDLINAGGNVNAKDLSGNTPLHLCKNVDVAKILLQRGANTNAKNMSGQYPEEIVPIEVALEIYEFRCGKEYAMYCRPSSPSEETTEEDNSSCSPSSMTKTVFQYYTNLIVSPIISK